MFRRLIPIVPAVLLLMAACSSDDAKPATTPAGTTPDAGSTSPDGSPASTFIDLGEIRSGVDVAFDIPDNALGFNITVEGSVADFNAEAQYGIERVTDPAGTNVHDGFTPAGGDQDTSIATFDTIAAVSVPQGDNTPAKLGGTWTLRVGSKSQPARAVKVRGKVRVQTSSDGVFRGGTLDLHVHVPSGLQFGAATLTAANAPTATAMVSRIDLFFQVTAALLGIGRGNVVFHEAPAKLASLNGIDALVDGFRVSKGATDGDQEMHILFTNEIAEMGEAIAAGISPGVPGAAGTFGRGVSTIIIAGSGSINDDVSTMIHEMGHFFGLNHTTEFDGFSADPLGDTPRCTTMDGSKSLQKLRACPDRTNVMFAAGALDAPITLSPTQKRVFHGSPIYRANGAGTTTSRSLQNTPIALTSRRVYRPSGGPLSPAEQELSLGFCGLNAIDQNGLLARHGRAQLASAAEDMDLHPIIRGRARVALRRLGL